MIEVIPLLARPPKSFPYMLTSAGLQVDHVLLSNISSEPIFTCSRDARVTSRSLVILKPSSSFSERRRKAQQLHRRARL